MQRAPSHCPSDAARPFALPLGMELLLYCCFGIVILVRGDDDNDDAGGGGCDGDGDGDGDGVDDQDNDDEDDEDDEDDDEDDDDEDDDDDDDLTEILVRGPPSRRGTSHQPDLSGW